MSLLIKLCAFLRFNPRMAETLWGIFVAQTSKSAARDHRIHFRMAGEIEPRITRITRMGSCFVDLF